MEPILLPDDLTGETIVNASQFEACFEKLTIIPNTDITALDSGTFQQPPSCTTVATISLDDVQFIAGPFKATFPCKLLPQKLAAAKHKNKEAREQMEVILLRQ
ncbi:MAG: hypothetical protein NXY57DRAFT_966874 [Lentinula lateritia]|nr:MAG: hypothetical protein NXY57DRAFT_966874 [Lentinula lateritia]